MIYCLSLYGAHSIEEYRNLVEPFACRMRTFGPEKLSLRGSLREMNTPSDGWKASS